MMYVLFRRRIWYLKSTLDDYLIRKNTLSFDIGSTGRKTNNRGGNMRYLVIAAVFAVASTGCSPKQMQVSHSVQTFSPVMIDMKKIEEKDYSQLIDAVNTSYAPQTKEYVDARLLKEEAMFMYFHIYSAANTGCFRVTVDKNRSRIINMQPDCSIDE